MCFPLHLQEGFPLGWQYSTFVFLGVNFFLLVTIIVLYGALLYSIWRTRKATEVANFDFDFAIRFFFIVFADGICWVPIMLSKMLVLFSFEISGKRSAINNFIQIRGWSHVFLFVDDLNSWLVVIVLPLNAAINPMLYTFTTPKYRKQVLTQSWNILNSRRDTNKTEGSLTLNPGNSMGKYVNYKIIRCFCFLNIFFLFSHWSKLGWK